MSIITDRPRVTPDRFAVEELARTAYARYLAADQRYEQARTQFTQAELERGRERKALLGLLAALDTQVDEYREEPPFTVEELGRINDLGEAEWGQFRVLCRMANASERR